jgi:hypothetical protein
LPSYASPALSRPTSKMLLITLDQLQHTAGLDTHILEHLNVRAPHLEGLWIPQVRKFLNKSMDPSASLTSPFNPSNGTMTTISWMLLSLTMHSLPLKFARLTSKTNLQEIHQERPNEVSWTIWRHFLNTISNFHGYLYQGRASKQLNPNFRTN